MNETEIQAFWEKNPCGEMLVGGMGNYGEDIKTFFEKYDEFRYGECPDLLHCLDAIDFKGKSVLEIGLGEGADSEQLIKRGAIWSGLDLTAESVARVKARMSVHKLKYNEVKHGSALNIPYESNSFDKVFSYGVLHHIPDIISAQKEIHRVLKNDGELVIMLYAKYSLNYLVSIFWIRRIALALLYVMGVKGKEGGKTYFHLQNAKKQGLISYLKMSNFVHRNTDGPLNPYAKVYTLKDVETDFPDFRVVRSYKNFMHAPPLPVHGFPLKGMLGWHLWIHLAPK